MNVLQSLRDDMLAARVARNTTLSSLYGLVVSEVENVGKNDGNRATTNDEAIALIKKMVARNEAMLQHVTGDPKQVIDDEIKLLRQYLPAMTSAADVELFIEALVENADAANIGMVMGAVKKTFGQSADMKAAGAYAKSILV